MYRDHTTFLRTSSLSLKLSNVTSTGLVPLTSGPEYTRLALVIGISLLMLTWALISEVILLFSLVREEADFNIKQTDCL